METREEMVSVVWRREYLVLRKQIITADVPKRLVAALDPDDSICGDGALDLDEWICSYVPVEQWQEVDEGIDNDDLEYGLADTTPLDLVGDPNA
jgi:hypothetical protein